MHDAILHCQTILGLGQHAWANEMNIGMNHAPGAGLISRPFDLPSIALLPG